MNNKTLKTINIALAIIFVGVAVYVFTQGPNNSRQLEPVITGDTNSENQTDSTALPPEKNTTADSQPVNVSGKLFSDDDNDVPAIEQLPTKLVIPGTIQLKGTITGPENIARAIIAIQPEKIGTPETSVVKINEEISGFCVMEIYKDHIVLGKNGQTGELWIKQKKSMLPAKTAVKSQGQVEKPIIVLPTSSEASREMADSISLDSEWSIAVSEDERPIGLTLENIKPLSPLALSGLKSGDIIKSINSQQLSSFQKTYQVLQKAKLQKELEIEIIRDGESHVFRSDITSSGVKRPSLPVTR